MTKNFNDDIQVAIIDQQSPIIIPFGPSCCGKTMMIHRLCRYLCTKGYHVNPDRLFRPPYDQHYQYNCENFHKSLCESIVPNTTGILLLEVKDPKGYLICYLLDVDGDSYCNPNNPNAPYPTFIHQIIHSPNPKLFIYFVEPDWADRITREHYVSSINRWQMHFDSQKNTAIILYNKIDKQPQFILPNNHVNYTAAVRDCQNRYPRLFDIFRRNVPLIRWFCPYRVKLIPFTSGTFNLTQKGTIYYIPSSDMFPEQLWKVITKNNKKLMNHKYNKLRIVVISIIMIVSIIPFLITAISLW